MRKVLALLCVMTLFAALAGVLGCGAETQEQQVSGSPEETVARYFDAVEKGDADALVSLLDPEGMAQAAEQSGLDLQEFEQQIKDYLTGTYPEGLRIEGLEYEVTVEGDTASVKVTAGTMYIESEGETTTQDLTTAEENLVLVRRDGKWYIELQI